MPVQPLTYCLKRSSSPYSSPYFSTYSSTYYSPYSSPYCSTYSSPYYSPYYSPFQVSGHKVVHCYGVLEITCVINDVCVL